MLLTSSLAGSLASAAVALFAPAQTCPATPDGHQFGLDFPAPGAHATHSVAGAITGDGSQDLALIADGTLAVFHSPATYDYPILPTPPPSYVAPLTSLAVASDGSGGADRVIAADGAGLIAWQVAADGSFPGVRLAGSAVAAGARSIEARDYDLDGQTDLLVVASNGLSLTTFQGASDGSFGLDQSISVGSAIVGATSAECDATSLGDELVVVTESAIEVRSSATGALLSTEPTLGTAQAAVRLHENLAPGFSVAILSDHLGYQYLSAWRPNQVFEPPFVVGLLDCTALSGGDADGDGDDDALLVCTFAPSLLGLINQSNGLSGTGTGPALTGDPTFDFDGLFVADYAPAGTDVSSQEAPVALADFDGDGDIDTAIPVTATGRVEFSMHGGVVAEKDQRPTYDCVYSETQEGEDVTVVLTVGMPLASAGQGFATLRCELWQDVASTGPVSVSEMAAPSPGGTVLIAKLLEGFAAPTNTSGYYFVVRPLRASGEPTGPSLVVSFGATAAGSPFDGIIPPLPWPDPTPIPRPGSGGNSTPPSGGSSAGSGGGGSGG